MSAAPEPPVSLSTLREAVRRAVAASSQRAVADAVGMSQRALRLFMNGETKPHASTVRNLTLWYLRESAGAHLDAETAGAAIDLLVNAYPERERARVRADLVKVLREAHRAAGTQPPKWLK